MIVRFCYFDTMLFEAHVSTVVVSLNLFNGKELTLTPPKGIVSVWLDHQRRSFHLLQIVLSFAVTLNFSAVSLLKALVPSQLSIKACLELKPELVSVPFALLQ